MSVFDTTGAESCRRCGENARAEVERLQAENEKLRKLAHDMWLHSYCSIAKTREEDEHHIESVIDRMRELGIEVN